MTCFNIHPPEHVVVVNTKHVLPSGEWLGEGSWWENNFTYCENTSWQQPLLVLMTGCLSNKIHVVLPYLMTQVSSPPFLSPTL